MLCRIELDIKNHKNNMFLARFSGISAVGHALLERFGLYFRAILRLPIVTA
jgi:hypothetical protein